MTRGKVMGVGVALVLLVVLLVVLKARSEGWGRAALEQLLSRVYRWGALLLGLLAVMLLVPWALPWWYGAVAVAFVAATAVGEMGQVMSWLGVPFPQLTSSSDSLECETAGAWTACVPGVEG